MVNYNKAYVVGIDIGNLNDISLRARNLFVDVEFFFCENTISTKKMLSNLDINLQNKEFISLHKFNEISRKELILKKLIKNDIIIISEAGTPTINDPGQYIINFLISNNVQVVPIPGSSALITALQSSGLIFDNFYFGGFLPKTESSKRTIFKELFKINIDVLIFYESPKRIENTLNFFNQYYSEFELVVCRELTKKYEEFFYGTAKNILAEIKNFKGEFVFIVKKTKKYVDNSELKEGILLLEKLNIDKNSQMEILEKIGNFHKKEIYKTLKK